MRKLITIAVSFFILASCSRKNDDESIKSITPGTLYKFHLEANPGADSTELPFASTDLFQGKMLFNNDGKGTMTLSVMGFSVKRPMKWRTSGDTLWLDSEEKSDKDAEYYLLKSISEDKSKIIYSLGDDGEMVFEKFE